MAADLREIVRRTTELDVAAFDVAFAGWTFHDYGPGMGVAFTKGTEFHFTPTPAFRFRRNLMRSQMRPLLEPFGFLTTRVQHDDTPSQRLNQLFGFKPTWADEHFQYSILTALPFKEKTCQQLQ